MTVTDSRAVDNCPHSFYDDKVRGVSVCIECGVVAPEKIYEENVYYGTRDYRSDQRSYHQSSHVVMTAGCRTSFELGDVPQGKTALFRRLSRLNNQNQGQMTDYLSRFVSGKVSAVCSKYGLSRHIKDEIFRFLSKIKRKNLFLGRTIDHFLWVVTHIICRRESYHHTLVENGERVSTMASPLYSLKEISKVEGVRYRNLSKVFSLVRFTFKIGRLPPIPVESRLHDVCEVLKSSGCLPNGAYEKILDSIDEIRRLSTVPILEGKDTIRCILAYIYLHRTRLGVGKITQTQLSRIGNITSVTLRTYIKAIAVD